MQSLETQLEAKDFVVTPNNTAGMVITEALVRYKTSSLIVEWRHHLLVDRILLARNVEYLAMEALVLNLEANFFNEGEKQFFR